MENIDNLLSKIRDFINSPRKQNLLLQNLTDWNMLCSSLDVIEDLELAIDGYLANLEDPATDGELYLILYGILQVLFVQQDALQNMVESLGLDYTRDPILKEIRKIRNDSVGHPTKMGSGQKISFNFISRDSMSRSEFMLMTSFPDKDTEFTNFNVPTLISDQRNILSKTLTEVIGRLGKEEMEHREKFKDENLADIFPQTLHYYYEKIGETIYGGKLVLLGAANLKLVIDSVERFKNALNERGILKAYDSVIYDLELVEYPLAELRKYFEEPDSSKLNSKDAYIFLEFIRHQIDTLIQYAKEIDEEYSSEA